VFAALKEMSSWREATWLWLWNGGRQPAFELPRCSLIPSFLSHSLIARRQQPR
jgi:hypothetical protein